MDRQLFLNRGRHTVAETDQVYGVSDQCLVFEITLGPVQQLSL